MVVGGRIANRGEIMSRGISCGLNVLPPSSDRAVQDVVACLSVCLCPSQVRVLLKKARCMIVLTTAQGPWLSEAKHLDEIRTGSFPTMMGYVKIGEF